MPDLDYALDRLVDIELRYPEDRDCRTDRGAAEDFLRDILTHYDLATASRIADHIRETADLLRPGQTSRLWEFVRLVEAEESRGS